MSAPWNVPEWWVLLGVAVMALLMGVEVVAAPAFVGIILLTYWERRRTP